MNKFALEKTAAQKWLHNLLEFLKPVIVLYIGAIVGVITINHGVVHLVDFKPSELVLGGIALYLLNGILDYLNKLK